MRTTPSGVTIDDTVCWCGADAPAVVGLYVGLIGPIEMAVCNDHLDTLLGEIPSADGVRPIPPAS